MVTYFNQNDFSNKNWYVSWNRNSRVAVNNQYIKIFKPNVKSIFLTEKIIL